MYKSLITICKGDINNNSIPLLLVLNYNEVNSLVSLEPASNWNFLFNYASG